MVPALIHVLIVIVIVGFLFWLVTWLLDQIGIPEPFAKVAKVLLAVIAFLVVLNAVLPLLGISGL